MEHKGIPPFPLGPASVLQAGNVRCSLEMLKNFEKPQANSPSVKSTRDLAQPIKVQAPLHSILLLSGKTGFPVAHLAAIPESPLTCS